MKNRNVKNTKWSILYQGIHSCDGATDVSYCNIAAIASNVVRDIKAGKGGKSYPENNKFCNRLLHQ